MTGVGYLRGRPGRRCGSYQAVLAASLVLPFLLAIVDAGAAESRRAPAEVPVAESVRISEGAGITLDGRLSEADWQRAPRVEGFLQRDPREGAPPTHPTTARFAYDATALYIAVEAIDPEPDRVVGILTRRDSFSPSDWVRVAIDSYFDRRSAFEFGVNAAGVKTDRYWFNDGAEDLGWDAVWDVAVLRHERGWNAEFRIPFSQLRFNPGASPRVGVAVVRTIGRLNETSTWPLLPRSAQGYVSSFGALELDLPRGLRRLELTPYVVSSLTTRPGGGSPVVNGTDPDLAGGLDFKAAMPAGFTLTGTVNPDFGQVEADPAVVNLSAFEIQFAERRPFFVEGSGIFRFDIDCSDGQCSGLFYSRRIGRAPQGAAPTGALDVSIPTQTTILGAAKLSGRVGGFSVGALQAVTSEERALVWDGASRTDSIVEPLTSYAVVRARREFTDHSALGFMVTATNRRLADTVRLLPGEAYTGGVDWDWRLGGRYSLTGFWAGSAVSGEPAAMARLQRANTHSFQRPDAAHVEFDPGRTRLDGHAGMFAISKIAGERVRFNSNVGFKSPGFEINDLGFLQRADVRTMGNWLQWRHDRPSRLLRSFRINFNQWAGWNFGGDRLYTGGNVNAHVVLTSNWSAGVGVNANAGGFADRLTRGGPGGLVNSNRSMWGYLSTDDRRPIFGGLFCFGLADGHATRRLELNPHLTVRPTAALSFGGGFRYARNEDDSQWVGRVVDAGEHHVFGRLLQTTVALTARVNYTITPDLSVQIYAEPFVSAGRYESFKELVDGRAVRYKDRYARFAYSGRPDFNYRSFRTTNVLRWEYRPGSTLFVVWQQNREGVGSSGDFEFGRDFAEVFSAPAENILLVKLALWVGR